MKEKIYENEIEEKKTDKIKNAFSHKKWKWNKIIEVNFVGVMYHLFWKLYVIETFEIIIVCNFTQMRTKTHTKMGRTLKLNNRLNYFIGYSTSMTTIMSWDNVKLQKNYWSKEMCLRFFFVRLNVCF